ncbi:hypothetical protein SESBI_51082 [Sesbania bispinosa]|nr:hypothetical protein SESBI_51082 [Sesbania bispinosa]
MRPISPSTATPSKQQFAETKERIMVLTCEEDDRLLRKSGEWPTATSRISEKKNGAVVIGSFRSLGEEEEDGK